LPQALPAKRTRKKQNARAAPNPDIFPEAAAGAASVRASIGAAGRGGQEPGFETASFLSGIYPETSPLLISVCPQSRLLCGQTLHFLA
jgi:hypothetical protein